MLRRTGKGRLILKRKSEDQFRNSCWSTDCAQAVESIYPSLAIGDMAQGLTGPGKGTRKQVWLSPFLLFPSSPTPASNSHWNYLNDDKKLIEKKESNYPSVSSACWWLGGKLERAQGKRMGRHEGDHPFGRSRRVSTAIFAYYIFITNHLPATLAALIPKHHQYIFPRHPSITYGWDYPLPTNRQTHPLTPTTVFTWKYLLQVPHSVSNRLIIVAKWKIPA